MRARLSALLHHKRFWEISAVAVLFGLSFLLTYKSLFVRPWDTLETWRQSDTYSIMVNYMKNGIDLFRPVVNYDGAGPNVIQRELLEAIKR